MTFDLFQAGAWPIGQSNLPSFSIPQELEKSVQMVSRPPLFYTMVTVMFQNEPLSCFSIPKMFSHDFIRKPQIVDTWVFCFIRNNNRLKKKKILGDFNT